MDDAILLLHLLRVVLVADSRLDDDPWKLENPTGGQSDEDVLVRDPFFRPRVSKVLDRGGENVGLFHHDGLHGWGGKGGKCSGITLGLSFVEFDRVYLDTPVFFVIKRVNYPVLSVDNVNRASAFFVPEGVDQGAYSSFF